ncbi:hypothetical protein GCM10018790_38120 [Kitasatospora xanthocidica]|uniref:DUF6461 domain-containing protein n=1 Tax=Kitasatospora xanthocidica TaxID=83382 RepID=UPI001673C7C3|nr:DUF6461 domain-containing protein [Kitasatospora xanthocidica]GHF56506.1 hypothetical protein GCM10018790_38120 [Kitasatospora xanthocidica]
MTDGTRKASVRDGDGIQWLAEVGRPGTGPQGTGGPGADGEIGGVVFARGIPPEELARRMGADPAAGTTPISGTEIQDLDIEVYRPSDDGDGVIRVGECGGWSFAIEYGDSTGGELLTEIARDGVEVVHFRPMPEQPPALLDYAHDGAVLCGFGLGQERWRWGQEPDLLVPDLVAAGVLEADGVTPCHPEGDGGDAAHRRTLGAVERRFGLSLPRAALDGLRLAAYAVRGTPGLVPR